MGRAFGVLCLNCDYSKESLLGVGGLYFSLENVISNLHHTKRKAINDILNNHDVVEVPFGVNPEYSAKIYRCSKCEGLSSRFYVKIEYDDNQIYETTFKCTKCRTVLEMLDENENLENYSCPNCKMPMLGISSFICWD